MEGDNLHGNHEQKASKIKVSRYNDILTDDDRTLLENGGQDLDSLIIQIKAPELDDLEGDFNGK